MAVINKDKYLTPDYKTFLDVVKKTKGKANNGTLYDLIDKYHCTAEELLPVANKMHNEGQIERDADFNHNRYAMLRRVNKRLGTDKKRGGRDFSVSLADYKWYFRYVPDEYLSDIPLDKYGKAHVRSLLGSKTESTNDFSTERSGAIYIWNNINTILFRDRYINDMLVDRLLGNKDLCDQYLDPFYKETSLEEPLYILYSGEYTTKPCTRYSKYAEKYCLRNVTNERYNLTEEQLGHIYKGWDLISQLYVLGMIMENESKNFVADNLKDVGRYVDDYILDIWRRNGVGYYQPEKARAELFSQAKTLEMLITMGIGIKVRNKYQSVWRKNNKKLNRRVLTSYKQFVKAKTVDERNSIRDLCMKQLDIINNDFMGRNFVVGKLNCADEQDDEFANQTGASVQVASTKGSTKKFDLAALASATTVVAGKGR